MELSVITSNSQWVKLFKDDPVRPQISSDFRCHQPDNIAFVLLEGDQPQAVLCCSFKSFVPETLDQLLKFEYASQTNAIFYTVWSYGRGGGKLIIPQAVKWIKENCGHITNFYTYSPFGSRVRDFHFSLGASLYRENSDSVNYKY